MQDEISFGSLGVSLVSRAKMEGTLSFLFCWKWSLHTRTYRSPTMVSFSLKGIEVARDVSKINSENCRDSLKRWAMIPVCKFDCAAAQHFYKLWAFEELLCSSEKWGAIFRKTTNIWEEPQQIPYKKKDASFCYPSDSCTVSGGYLEA